MPRAPRFWQQPAGFRATLLAPLAALYASATARRLARGQPHRLGIPVICIGNLTAGGSGKTPVVIALTQRLLAQGVKVQIVSKGYGGTLEGPVQVDPHLHDASAVGDEPLLLAAFAPVWVAKDRVAGGRAAEAAGAEVILLDDGFQDPSLEKDLSLVVVDARLGFGNGRVIPAGPLREPVAVGLKRADLIVSIGNPADQERLSLPDLLRLQAELRPLQTGMDWAGMPVYAFAGIGYPEKFFRTLRQMGADIRGTVPLTDHQELTPALLKRLEEDAKRARAQLVTTEKDAVRLPQAFQQKVLTVPVRLESEDWRPLDEALLKVTLAS